MLSQVGKGKIQSGALKGRGSPMSRAKYFNPFPMVCLLGSSGAQGSLYIDLGSLPWRNSAPAATPITLSPVQSRNTWPGNRIRRPSMDVDGVDGRDAFPFARVHLHAGGVGVQMQPEIRFQLDQPQQTVASTDRPSLTC